MLYGFFQRHKYEDIFNNHELIGTVKPRMFRDLYYKMSYLYLIAAIKLEC